MGAYAWRIDPSGTVYNLTDNTNTFLTAQEVPPPPTVPQFISSRDVDGDALVDTRYGNRTVTLGIRVVGSSQSDIEDRTQLLQAAITKLHREGGVLEGTSPAGTVFYLDVLDAQMTVPQGKRYMTSLIAEPVLEFTCKPFIYGTENTPDDHVETSSPCLIFTEASVAGDVPALGRLVVDEDQAADQAWLVWGLRSKNYSADSDAALYYDAVGRTAMQAGAGTSTAATGYTGSGSVLANNLTTRFLPILSTQATGGGNHLEHVGAYRVFARFQAPSANTGAVSVALQWGVGDFRMWTQNATAPLYPNNSTADAGAWGGTWRIANLGIVRIPSVLTGTQRWEGRVLAKSTIAGDSVHVDHLFLVPCDEGYGEATSIERFSEADTPVARDEYAQSAGNLSGKTAAVGGTYTTGNATTDFTIDTSGKTAQRTTTGDIGSVPYGRFATLGSSWAGVAVQADVKWSASINSDALFGVTARYTDTDNHVRVAITPDSSSTTTTAYIYVRSGASSVFGDSAAVPVAKGTATWMTIRLIIGTQGDYEVWVGQAGSTLTLAMSGYTKYLAPNAVASGSAGLWDYNGSVTACTRNYDNLVVWTPGSDAACFASRSAQVRYNGVIRQDSGGSYYQGQSDYTGDYMLVPPAGREARTNEMFVKMCRNDPTVGADSAVDDISAKLYITPRYLTIPT